ncbi:WD repeat protein Cdt2 [Schizosaccharomyces osmophilus]|uniref:WD repeat protein Cdt2 n=1 Tax=Schizosaccharomyces osmophilus TaxID=2545709 RepID=A0AAE9WFF2_9SCHI|nr:WD repeat protein Cdt2 [Schizosaccharomyces osmophilus]WBW73793.1 WD repeat protein Cdt2 [Schizosaccharomyces osmophilus]
MVLDLPCIPEDVGGLKDITLAVNNSLPPTPDSSPAGTSKKHKLYDFLDFNGKSTKPKKRVLFDTSKKLHKPPVSPKKPSQLCKELLARQLGGTRSRISRIPSNRHVGNRLNLETFYSRPSECLMMLNQLPFCLGFAHNESLLAVCTETGALELFDSKYFARQNEENQPSARRLHGWLAHNNAIFNVNFSSDDSLLATSSGDQTAKVFDLATQQCITRLGRRGFEGYHSHSVKQVNFCDDSPYNIVTCSRDGSLIFWDMRTHGITVDGEHHQKPVLKIKKAHERQNRDCSVTSAVWLPNSTSQVVSSCSGNSTLKLWDLRNIHTVRPLPLSSTPGSKTSKRDYGITSVCASPAGDRVYAASRDNTVYEYSAQHLESGPYKMYNDPRLRISSFYVKIACSPDGSTLACGGGVQNENSGAILFDTTRDDSSSSAMLVGGHSKDVTAVDWSNDNQLASISDDGSVRVWNSSLHGTAANLREKNFSEIFYWGHSER